MDRLDFEQLCCDTSVELGVEDIGALGQGFSLLFNSVAFETVFHEGDSNFLLTAELGTVEEACRTRVYENLLTTQLMAWNRPGLRFGFDPQRRTVMLCVDAAFNPQTTSAWLAALVRSIAAQTLEWRKTLLAGIVRAGGLGHQT